MLVSGSTGEMQHPLGLIDEELWERMQQRDEATLNAALGAGLSGGEIRSILERRDVMEGEIAKLIDAAERGERDVFVRYPLGLAAR